MAEFPAYVMFDEDFEDYPKGSLVLLDTKRAAELRGKGVAHEIPWVGGRPQGMTDEDWTVFSNKIEREREGVFLVKRVKSRLRETWHHPDREYVYAARLAEKFTFELAVRIADHYVDERNAGILPVPGEDRGVVTGSVMKLLRREGELRLKLMGIDLPSLGVASQAAPVRDNNPPFNLAQELSPDGNLWAGGREPWSHPTVKWLLSLMARLKMDVAELTVAGTHPQKCRTLLGLARLRGTREAALAVAGWCDERRECLQAQRQLPLPDVTDLIFRALALDTQPNLERHPQTAGLSRDGTIAMRRQWTSYVGRGEVVALVLATPLDWSGAGDPWLPGPDEPTCKAGACGMAEGHESHHQQLKEAPAGQAASAPVDALQGPIARDGPKKTPQKWPETERSHHADVMPNDTATPHARPRGASERTILHLSDLHFAGTTDAEQWHTQLASDLRHELGVTRLDAVVVSGDIGNTAVAVEYEQARRFFERLQSSFDIAAGRIVLVPGNHDVSWGASERAYRPTRRKDYAGPLDERRVIDDGGKFVEVRDDNAYLARFAAYRTFHEAVTGAPYAEAYDEQASIQVFDSVGVLFLGLNSSWEIDHHYRARAAIHPGALSRALDAMATGGASRGLLKIAVWHHPIHSGTEDRIRDAGFLELLAQNGFSVALHGHIHKAEDSTFAYDKSVQGRRIRLVAAGTFGAPVREWVPGFPLQYNLLRVGDGRVTVETRCRDHIAGAWKPDARWLQGPGRDPSPRYFLEVG